MSRVHLRLSVLVCLVTAAALTIGTLVGFRVAETQAFPYRQLAAMRNLIVSVNDRTVAGTRPAAILQTTHVRLRRESLLTVETGRGEGGGLTSAGQELILMTHEGSLFAAGQTGAERLPITVPDNGREAYRAAAAKPDLAGMYHNPDWLRYNDVLFYSDPRASGLVISYTEWLDDKRCYGTTLAQLPLPAGVRSLRDFEAGAEDWRIVFRTEPCLDLKTEMRAIEGHMAGGRLAYLAPGRVLLGSGDYHWDGVYASRALSQAEDNDYGKVLEIDLATGNRRILSSGNRNMQGLLVDDSGRLWATEHGPRGGDELNLIAEGGDYGWPSVTLGTRYNGLPWPGTRSYGRHDGFVSPVYSWLPSIGISNLTQARGFHPAWNGDLLVASLSNQTLYRLRIADERVVFSEPIKIGARIRYVHLHVDGKLYLWTDSHELLALAIDETSATEEFIDDYLASLPAAHSARGRIRAALSGCQECHSIDMEPGRAPPLGDVYGRHIASTQFDGYSKALSERGGTWSAAALAAYIRDPASHVPGTTMPSTGIEDPLVIDGIVDVLRSLRLTQE